MKSCGPSKCGVTEEPEEISVKIDWDGCSGQGGKKKNALSGIPIRGASGERG